MAAEAERLGFTLMLGSMVATSLSVAPAMLVAQSARFVDLDGPPRLPATGPMASSIATAWFTRRPRLYGADRSPDA